MTRPTQRRTITCPELERREGVNHNVKDGRATSDETLEAQAEGARA
jgi:hypothetical protein